MKEPKARYTSARTRLQAIARFGRFFEGRHAMQLFDWDAKTAAHYLWLWRKQGLVEPLGGKSDIFFNLAADPDAKLHVEEAIRTVMPGAVVGPLNVLNESGLTTQRPGSLQLLVPGDARQFTIRGAMLQSRSQPWWRTMALHGGIVAGNERTLARLAQGAAVADSALSPGGLDPDDVDFEVLRPAERKRALALLRVLSPVVSPNAGLENAYAQAWDARRAAGDDRRRIRRSASPD